MSKQIEQKTQVSGLSADDKRVNRRRFMTSVAVGAGLAPLAAALGSKATASVGQAVNDLCYGTVAPITPSDMRYLGALRVPDSGCRLDYSRGPLTGRRVGNELRLFTTGHVLQGAPVAELAVDVAPSMNQLSAPRLRLVRNWGDVTGGKRLSWDATGAPRAQNLFEPAAIHWSERNQMLYWTYYDIYNVLHHPDFSLGGSRLNSDGTSTAYGPWRTFASGKYGPWRTINLAENPVDGSMLCGSKIQSGNSISPWGPDMWRGQYPTASTPSGLGSPDIQLSKYLTYYFQYVDNAGNFTTPIHSCRRPGTYIFEPTPVGEKTEIDPTKNNGVGSWTSMDQVNGMTWIEKGNKRGVLFTGRMVDGHVWYSNAGVGTLTCTHGIVAPQGTTGPNATGAHPFIAIYDADDLEAVAAGRLTDYTVQPTLIDAGQQFGCITAPVSREGSLGTFGGSYFDPVDSKLYVTALEADATLGQSYQLPLIHVWDIL